ncbi:MAG TPA: hypothetical protein VMU28_09690 [Terriglobales bacterium]|nr:hypothetical protein [Terriglobales bacterium]
MAKVLTVGCDLQRLSQVNSSLRARSHYVRGADCRSTMRHLLALEPFHYIIILDQLPPLFSEALSKELHAGRLCPRVLRAEGMRSEDVLELLPENKLRKAA